MAAAQASARLADGPPRAALRSVCHAFALGIGHRVGCELGAHVGAQRAPSRGAGAPRRASGDFERAAALYETIVAGDRYTTRSLALIEAALNYTDGTTPFNEAGV
ncbi:hypothetical protein PPSIR1_05438 [Plesiocystis pacifica SIR-1]|uniref:Uncharacterized protein n=1 Tax=Plesiocystis pacifica SIR-1 TaxID=391625 RepID=A6FX60_9BACT|nr:hypothetical protein PPSIR1_05438 [Plesiocystis pacifica SIR-1]